MEEEWGPWIEHDGGPCPCEGEYGRVQIATGEVFSHVLGTIHGDWDGPVIDCWNWDDPLLRIFAWHERVIRYRIRKPRGLTMLEEIAKGVREPVDA